MCEKLKISIIDDDLVCIKILEGVLKEGDNKLTLHRDPIEALSEMEKNPPDLVLMDIEMPKIDGISMCHIMRDKENLREVPIILISGREEIGDMSLYFKGVDFMTKPLDGEKLKNKIRLYTSLHKMITLTNGKEKK